MLKVGNLIEDFRNQTKETIQEHLDKLATNRIVYSTHLKGFDPYLKEKNVIIYIHATSMVVVCFDLCGKIEEIVDEVDEVDIDPPQFFSHKGARTSPVWQLREAMALIRDRIINIKPPIDVYGVLLSESDLLNAADMKDRWDIMNIHVIHGLKGLRHKEIVTNEFDYPKTKAIMDAIQSDPINREDKQDEDDDLAKLINYFLSGDNKDDDEDDDDDEINPDDFPEGSVHVLEDISFPDGKIEQNNNITTYVDILRPIANPREELDKLVGCNEIGRRMDELLALVRYNKMMREMFPNSKQHAVSLYSVFYGKPGTGKTTVCKIFGSLLRQAGALSKGHVVVCDRGTFIGTLWGDEERSMRQVLEMAQGGVLMVDEAYLLNGKNENDPGKIVVQLMMNILADESQRDIAIVLCGYKEPMMELLNSNPGLQSRFPNKFEFPDFTIDELLEITRRRVKEYEYEFTPSAWEKYKQLLVQAYQHRNLQTWGNARFVANQLERIYIQHASRCVKQCPADKYQLRLISTEDILPIEVPIERNRIGF